MWLCPQEEDAWDVKTLWMLFLPFQEGTWSTTENLLLCWRISVWKQGFSQKSAVQTDSIPTLLRWKQHNPGPWFGKCCSFSWGEVSPAGQVSGALWHFPIKQNGTKRRNKLSDLGCKFSLILKMDRLYSWEGREGKWGRAEPSADGAALLLAMICSVRPLTKPLMVGEGVPAVQLAMMMGKEACSALCANGNLYGASCDIWQVSARNLRLPVGSCCSFCGCFRGYLIACCSVLNECKLREQPQKRECCCPWDKGLCWSNKGLANSTTGLLHFLVCALSLIKREEMG